MRYAVISDVHANLEALNAVIKKIREEHIDRLWFLGDIVGYGPDPLKCIETLEKEADVLIAGNHDQAAIGLVDIAYFNPYARAAIEWTHDILGDKERAFLKQLPIKREMDGVLLVHSTPIEPGQWHYLMSVKDAFKNFRYFKENVCFIGHSHQPEIMELSPDNRITVYREHSQIREGHRYIINAGSVGQPRDGNPDSAYVLIDKNSIKINRCPYDIVSTQKKMRLAGLPAGLIDRLSRGI
ncbi:MAG TPA: metallophosphoesterase [Nitrospirae bacterium]|nr:phosphodiesterase [bacterium BMS3Abin10]GBE38335.1 phosphodiesterase [bacterium BMS3Bbin08]HDH49908.1 metallophosphoesterase [Nitrospirota bacterium]HDK17028.1 metallophosphoesterase [Nitrospirota bacterium]HDK82665.1 metallophosphoesterase [Nitrospirota bacterium]